MEGKASHTMQNEVGAKPGGSAIKVQLNSELLTAHMTVQNDVGGLFAIKLKTFDKIN